MATSQNLEGMKLIELKELAKQMGLRGTSTMRKPELVATLQAARSGGEAPAGVTVRPVKGAASKRPSRRSPLHRPRRLRNRLSRRSQGQCTGVSGG
ncbi:Rho termination factor N-terminal domain-containing protein [Bifidobacterium bifidum]|uniref:Rho termination factor N-terminal domain-containing protein n=1 Tax=Bifidobacterium bifidum TaxID=1681 RepID=UPI000B02CACE